MPDHAAIRENLKRLIVESLHLEGLVPDKIGSDTPLFGGGLGLDSVDALELVVAIEREYRISVKAHEMDKSVFATVTTLADFIAGRLAASGVPAGPDGS